MSARFRSMIVAFILATLFMTMVGCTKTASSGGQEATPTPIPEPPVPEQPTYTVKRGQVIDSLNFTGRVSPLVEEDLYFRTSGRVRKVYVQRNDMVEAGTLLAELENDDLVTQLQQAQLELDTATENLNSAQEDLDYNISRAKIALEIQKLQLAKAEESSDNSPDVAIAQASLERAQAAVRVAQANYDVRGRTPGVDGSPQALALEQATIDLQVAQANYDRTVASQSLSRYDLQIQRQQVALAQLELDRLNQGLDPQLASAVERAQLNVERLQAFVDETRIVSPVAGKVTSVSVDEAKTIEAYKTAFVVSDDTSLEILAEPLSSQLQELGEGMNCTITLQQYPGQELKGTVTQLPYPYGSGGGSGQTTEDVDKSTHISFDPGDLALKTGDLVKVVVILEEKDDTLWLPPAAIRTFSGRRFVVIEEDGVQRRVDVTVGIESEERVEILDGVEEGQIVIGQ